MGPIWQRIRAQAAAYESAGLSATESMKRALQNMTKSEAIAALNEAVETVKGYSASIRAIAGSNRDPECRNQIAINSKYITRYLNEINLYSRSTDEKFATIFPSLTFLDIPNTLQSLERCAAFFVSRGPRYNPPI